MDREEPFLEWLKTGKILVENGTIQFLRAYNLLFPVSCLLELDKILKDKFGEKESKSILRELGKFQIKQALVRYVDILGVKEIGKSKWENFIGIIPKILGYGNFQCVINYQEKMMTFRGENVPTAIQYKLIFGKSEKPIDHYLCGMLDEVGISIFGIPMKCIETKCIACGDPYCEFQVFPAEEEQSKT